MKKKNKSLVVILAALMLFSVVQVFDFARAKADEMPSAKTLFEATNTYNLNGSVTKETSFEKYHEEKGYDNPQYEFNFDMSSKNNNQTTLFHMLRCLHTDIILLLRTGVIMRKA